MLYLLVLFLFFQCILLFLMCNKITIKYLYKICNNKVHHAEVGGGVGEAGGQEKENRRWGGAGRRRRPGGGAGAGRGRGRDGEQAPGR